MFHGVARARAKIEDAPVGKVEKRTDDGIGGSVRGRSNYSVDAREPGMAEGHDGGGEG